MNLAGRSNFQTTGAVLVNNFGSNEWNGNFTISNAGGGYGIRSDLGLLTISGGLRSNTATRSWEVGGTGNVLISGIIGGSTGSSATSTLGFNKFGAGTVTLSAANTHGASTTINAGTLLLTNALALQNSTVDLKTADAGTLSFGSSLTTASFGALTGSRNLTLLNTNAAPAAVTLSVGNASATSYTYTGIISGGNLYKIGGGTGTFTLDPGTGVAVSINSLSANAGTMILKSGNIGTAGIDPGQTAYTMGAGARGGTLTVDGANLTIGGNRRFVVGAATAGTGNLISGSITASQVVIGHNGAATMAQSGGTVTTTNVYHQDAGSGAYTLTGGTLIAQSIYNNTANTGGTQTFTLNLNGGTLRAATGTTNLITTANIGTQISVLLGTGNTQIDTSLSNATIARPMGDMSAQVGTFTKIGANTLTLTQANTYTGATQISGGTLALTGTASIASPSIIVGASTTFDVSGVTGGYSLGSTQTISGTGSVAGAMAVSGTLSPGNSPGSISTGSQTWLNGGDFNWQMLDANGVAGTGYDTIAITGTLDLSSLTTGGFNINLWSLATIGPDVNGNAANFLGLNDYSWTLASASTAITSFNAANFFINVGSNNGTAGFSNGLDGGAFSVSQSGNNLLLNFTAIPEPDVSALLGGLGMIALLRRSRQA